MDLIDFQSHPEDGMSRLVVYQDHGLKFAHLVPSGSKQCVSVARVLMHIFSLQGAPGIRQSDNGREFVNQVIEAFAGMWSGCKIVHGRARHPQSQGSVERLNQTIERMMYKYIGAYGEEGSCVFIRSSNRVH